MCFFFNISINTLLIKDYPIIIDFFVINALYEFDFERDTTIVKQTTILRWSTNEIVKENM